MISFIVIIVSFVLIYLLLNLNSFVKEKLKKIDFDNKLMKDSLREIHRKIDLLDPKEPISEKVVKESNKEKEKLLSYSAIKKETDKLTPIKESEEKEVPIKEEVLKEDNIIKEKPKPQLVKETPIFKKPIKKVVKQSFFDKHPDIEKFIGESIINKIGIVVLVFGLGFLVKYAIDKNWINEIGRVAIGVLSASALLALAHKLRKEYKSFSSVLIGGGLALLYFTIAFAFHTEGYPLYGQQTTAFVILVLITIFAVFLAITYDRIEIAIFAMLGGFLSPFLISNGTGNYIVLFSYLSVLNIGMLVLSYYKKWRAVNFLAFGLTMLIFFSWLTNEILDTNYAHFKGAIFFATGFYMIFFLMNIIYNLKNKISLKSLDISILLANTFLYFSFVMVMLTYVNGGAYKGLFSVLLGLFNFVFAYYFNRNKKADKKLVFLLIGLVFTFITLAIPLQLDGNYITLFWSIESVLLLWLSQKSGFKILKLGSVIVLFLMLISLFMDWTASYQIEDFTSGTYVKEFIIIFNKMYITVLVSVISLVATLVLLKNEKKDFYFISVEYYKLFITVLAFILFYIGGLLEVNYQSIHYFNEGSNLMLVHTYNALFVLGLLLFSYRQNQEKLLQISGVIGAIFVFLFFFILISIYAGATHDIIVDLEIRPKLLLVLRWISIIAVYIISLLLYKISKKLQPNFDFNLEKGSLVFLVFTIIFLLSADLDTIALLISKSRGILAHTQKTGYAILWGFGSLLLMVLGMKNKNKTLRVLSLVLFAITLIKLFVYDISNISEGGKIVAFILLGILLLIISFMYQKLKKLVIDDTKKFENNDLTH